MTQPAIKGHYGSKINGTYTVLWVTEKLGISPYRLAKLLSVAHQTVYQWTNGHERPSSRYWELMMRLVLMVDTQEIKMLPLVEKIDWTAGLIHFKANHRGERPSPRKIEGYYPESVGDKFMAQGEKFLNGNGHKPSNGNGHSLTDKFLEAEL